MSDTGRRVEKYRWVITLLCAVLFIIPTPFLLGAANDVNAKEEESKIKSDFVLTIKDNLISLDAKDASLVEIVEEIGSRMKIDVVTKIPEEKKITTKFDRLPLEAAIERLREYADIAYIKDSESEKGKITKILVFEKGKGTALSKTMVDEEEEEEKLKEPEIGAEEAVEEEAPRPEPFKFEFDPSKFEEEEK